MMIAGGFTCQRYGFNVGADKFSLLTIENGKNKHYAPIGMDIDFPKPKISLRQAASFCADSGISRELEVFENFSPQNSQTVAPAEFSSAQAGHFFFSSDMFLLL